MSRRILSAAALLWVGAIAFCPPGGRASAAPDAVAVIVDHNDANNIVTYGDFEDVDENDPPLGLTWGDHKYFKLMTEAGNHFLRLTSPPGPDGKGMQLLAMVLRFQIDPKWRKVRIAARIRARHIVLGAQPWENARIAPLFEDAHGQNMGYPPALDVKQDTDWVDKSEDVTVPKGAVYVKLSLESFASGTIDYDDIRLEPNPPPVSHPWRKDLPEGNFDKLDPADYALIWRPSNPQRVKLLEEDGKHFLRLENSPDADGKAEGFLAAPCRFRLDPTWKKVRIQARMRAHNLQVGQQNYEKARLAPLFEDATGVSAGDYQPVLDLSKDSDWVDLKEDLAIPPGSIYVTLSPEMIGCRGVVDYADIRLEPIIPPPGLTQRRG